MMRSRICRRAAAFAMMIAAAVLLAACRPLIQEADQSISIYASFYPIYALTEGVIRDVPDAELHCLVQPQDGCLRDYALSDWDAALLAAGADAVIIGGRGLERFEDTLFGWGEKGPAISAVLYNLGLLNGDKKADAESESHLDGPNPHLYMSLAGAQKMVESISATMVSLDPQYGDTYVKNTESALKKLESLLAETRALLADCAGQRVSLMNETLVYIADDYGLEVAAQIDRESAAPMGDNELAACLERLSEAEARVVLVERQAPPALVEALEAAGFCVACIDVLSTHREGEGFDAYLEIQRGNAQAVRGAFDRAQAGKDDR